MQLLNFKTGKLLWNMFVLFIQDKNNIESRLEDLKKEIYSGVNTTEEVLNMVEDIYSVSRDTSSIEEILSIKNSDISHSALKELSQLEKDLSKIERNLRPIVSSYYYNAVENGVVKRIRNEPPIEVAKEAISDISNKALNEIDDAFSDSLLLQEYEKIFSPFMFMETFFPYLQIRYPHKIHFKSKPNKKTFYKFRL